MPRISSMLIFYSSLQVKVEAEIGITFRRVKLEIGQGADSTEAVFVTRCIIQCKQCIIHTILYRGKLTLDNCLVEATL